MLQLARENKNPTIDDTKTATKLVNKIKCEQKVMVLKKEDNLANYLCSVMLRLQT